MYHPYPDPTVRLMLPSISIASFSSYSLTVFLTLPTSSDNCDTFAAKLSVFSTLVFTTLLSHSIPAPHSLSVLLGGLPTNVTLDHFLQSSSAFLATSSRTKLLEINFDGICLLLSLEGGSTNMTVLGAVV